MGLEAIEVQDQTVIVHLHATTPTATCPQCGTVGSRVHSRDPRTIADVAFGGRSLVRKLARTQVDLSTGFMFPAHQGPTFPRTGPALRTHDESID